MNHEAAREKLLDRAYGELPPAEARELEAHLAGCAGCRAEAERIERTRGLMRQLGPEPEPGGEGILLAAARQAAGARKPRFSWLTLSLATGAVATVLVAVVTLRMPAPPPADRAEEAFAARPEPPPRAVAPEAAGPRSAPLPPSPAAPPAAAPEPTRQLARRLAAPQRAAVAKAAPAEAGSLTSREAARAEAGPVRDLAEPEPEPEPEAAGRQRAPAAAPAAPQAFAVRPAPAAARRQSPAAGAAEVPAPRADGPDEELLREVRELRASGALNEARRHPDPCPGGDTLRLVWLDGWGKARRFARTGPAPGGGEATRDHYYDGAGRARLVIIDGEGAAGHFRRRILLDEQGRRLVEDPADAPPWPDSDLALRDGAEAFWAPQRCGR